MTNTTDVKSKSKPDANKYVAHPSKERWDQMIEFCEAAKCSPDSLLSNEQLAQRFNRYNPSHNLITTKDVTELMADAWEWSRSQPSVSLGFIHL